MWACAKLDNLRRVRITWSALVFLGCATTQVQAQDAVRSAEQWIASLAAGRWTDAAAQVSEAVPAGRMGAAQLERIWVQLESAAGKLRGAQPSGSVRQDTFQIVLLNATFEREQMVLRVVVMPSGKVAGFSIAPPAAAVRTPPYADTSKIREEPVNVGREPWLLPGALTLPKAAGRHPVVVLVHGSGPSDRDETYGPNRPFRDLALGLTSRGIAVLRYDKRSFVHGTRMPRSITVEDEVMEDALAALAVARAHPSVDPARVYLLGHSLGAQLAPEIAVRDGKTAGVILLAAPARPISALMLEQFDYLAALPQNAAENAQAQLRLAREAVTRYRTGNLPDSVSILGASVRYLRDLDARDAIVTAQRLTVPLLVLQGERDYQVTMEDFGRWRAALESRSATTLRSFPSLNHLFIAATGPPNPLEYSVPAHVSQDVIDAMATWLQR